LIVGKHIRLRAVEQEDLLQFVEWLNDPELRSGLAMFLPFSLAEEKRWFERMQDTPAAEHVLVIEAQDNDLWRSIGTCGLHAIDWQSRQAEVGISIGDKSFWNRGYGTDTMRAILQHGFDTLNLNRIYLRVFSNNQRAIRCYEKAGFVQEGRLRQAHYQGGEYLDILMMGVLRDEWVR
jgi:RimJ/RimL family protein N-acetyltransferase